MEKDSEGTADPTAPTVILDFIKSSSFRSLRADGVIGGITPNGHIHMAFFSERAAIPRRAIHVLNDDGTLGELRELQTRDSIVREMEVDMFLTLETAKSINDWLGKKINELENLGKEDADK